MLPTCSANMLGCGDLLALVHCHIPGSLWLHHLRPCRRLSRCQHLLHLRPCRRLPLSQHLLHLRPCRRHPRSQHLLHRHHWCSLRRPTTSRSTPRLSGAAQMNNGAASVASGSLLDGSLPDEHSEPKIDPGNGGTSAPNAGHLRLETPTGIGAKEKLAGDKSIKPRSIDDEEAYPPLATLTPSGLFL